MCVVCMFVHLVVGAGLPLRSHADLTQPDIETTQFIGANLAYKSNVDLSKAADFDGWVPPAMLDAARDIQAMKTKFPAPAPAAGVQRGLQLSNSIVTVRPGSSVLLCVLRVYAITLFPFAFYTSRR